jgi:hypothetical protein
MVVSFAGPLVGRSEQEYAELALSKGAELSDTVERGRTTHLISSPDAEALFSNEYKVSPPHQHTHHRVLSLS